MRSHVYDPRTNQYLQIKKFDEGKKVYLCRAKEEKTGAEESGNADVEMRHEDVSDQINVRVRVITEEKQMSAQIQVGINEKIVGLKEYFKIKGGALNTIYKGELVKGEDTYFKRMIKSGEQFILMSGSFEAKKWKRFPK